MCKPLPKVTAGAMLVSALSPRVTLATMAVAGSGVALVVVAGTGLNAYALMGLTAYAALTTIALIRRKADTAHRAAYGLPTHAPQRAHAQILSARPRALPAAAPTVEVIERRAVESR